MFEKMKSIKRNFILLSLFYLILGIILVAYPDTSGKVICYMIAGFALVYGIFHLAAYFVNRIPFNFRYDLIIGIIGVTIGIYFIVFPDVILRVLPMVLGMIVLVDGLVKVQTSLDLKNIHYDKWWIFMTIAVVAILLGILMIFYPFASMMSIIMFVGISLIANAIADLVHIFIISKKFKQFHQGND